LTSLFPVPGEVDPIAVFWEIATKGNFDRITKRAIGPYRDFSLALKSKDSPEVLGGVDFVVYRHRDGPITVDLPHEF
jgi:hypothetical protein